MVDANKKIEITEDFLEKHRSNTRKYMHLLNSSKEKSESLQGTLSRIESRFGVNIKRSQSNDTPTEHIRFSQDDKSLQEYIREIRQKYLSPADPPVSFTPSLSEPLIDLSPPKPSNPQLPLPQTSYTPHSHPQGNHVSENLLDLQLFTPVKNSGKEKDTLLQVSDLISDPSPVQISPYHKPPRSKHSLDESAHETLKKKIIIKAYAITR